MAKIDLLFAKGLLGVALLSALQANAGMVLTSDGATAGFGLTTFIDQYAPFSGIGPLGIAFPVSGGVMTTEYNGAVRNFSSTADGQHAGDAGGVHNYGPSAAIGLTSVGGDIYMTSQGGFIYKMNDDGTVASTLNNTIGLATGITNDGTDLYVSSGYGGLIHVSVATGVATLFKTGTFDGLAVSGGVLYGSQTSSGHVYGYDLSDGSEIFDSGAISGGIDGIAVGQGTLAGNLFINLNDGTLWQSNLATHALTKLAEGGSRGDFVAVAPDGSLLLTQSDSILRLTAPEGASFGDTAPEPGTVLTMLGGLGILAFGRRKRLF